MVQTQFGVITLPHERRLWQQAEHGELCGVDATPLHYSCLLNPQDCGAIVLICGRLESYLKYWDLVETLYQQGYSVYLMDHRGQGLSGRLLENPMLGYVADFNHYVYDLEQFYQVVVAPAKHRHHFMLAHSMGGAVGTLYLQRNPHHFDAAAFSAPMWGVNFPVPTWLVRAIAWSFSKLPGQRYVPGAKDYTPVPFASNQLTRDPEQYRLFRALYDAMPELQLGGASVHWLRQSIRAMAKIKRSDFVVSTPILALQAGAETIVDNHAQQQFIDRSEQHILMHFPDAKHELLIEQADVRQQVIAQILLWFQQHRKD